MDKGSYAVRNRTSIQQKSKLSCWMSSRCKALWRPSWWLRHWYTTICSLSNFLLGQQGTLIWVLVLLWHQHLSLCVTPATSSTDTVSSSTEALIGSGVSPTGKCQGTLIVLHIRVFCWGGVFTYCNLGFFCTLGNTAKGERVIPPLFLPRVQLRKGFLSFEIFKCLYN